jgi:hypothetical protein
MRIITLLIFVCMYVVTGGRKCIVNFNKQTLQLYHMIFVCALQIPHQKNAALKYFRKSLDYSSFIKLLANIVKLNNFMWPFSWENSTSYIGVKFETYNLFPNTFYATNLVLRPDTQCRRRVEYDIKRSRPTFSISISQNGSRYEIHKLK